MINLYNKNHYIPYYKSLHFYEDTRGPVHEFHLFNGGRSGQRGWGEGDAEGWPAGPTPDQGGRSDQDVGGPVRA